MNVRGSGSSTNGMRFRATGTEPFYSCECSFIREPTVTAVAILGGMGPLAGADLLEKFLAGCVKEISIRGGIVNDQAYPVHYLAQWPHPDRTRALLTGDAEQLNVLHSLSDSIAALERLNVKTIAIACNTAHAWHQKLAAIHPGIDLLNIAEVTARAAAKRSIGEVGLLATKGTCKAKIYQQYFDVASILCHEPDACELDWLMAGIYQGVKAGKLEFAEQCFKKALSSMQERTGANAFVMGCTEIPIVLAKSNVAELTTLIDPTVELGLELARRAYSQGSATDHRIRRLPSKVQT